MPGAETTLSIDAKNVQEALDQVSAKQHVSSTLLSVLSATQLANGLTRFQINIRSAATPPPIELSFENLLENLESQLSKVQTHQLLEGYSAQELSEKGLLDVPEETVRSGSKFARVVGSFLIPAGVDYAECDELFTHDMEWLLSMQKIDPVQIDTVIAMVKNRNPIETKKLLETGVLPPFPISQQDFAYQICEGGSQVISKIQGHLLINKNRLFLLPCDIPAQFILDPLQGTMEATGSFLPPFGRGAPLSFNIIIQRLEGQGIVFGIRSQAIFDALDLCNTKSKIANNVCLAKGMPSINGRDSAIEYFYSQELGTEEFSIMPDGRIDYKRKVKIPTAHPGDLLIKIALPSSGQPGMDIKGEMIAALPGRAIPISPGQGVRTSVDGREFYATCTGQICQTPDSIAVLPIFEIHGDVDSHRGNIEFDGSVVVFGNILTGFTVKTKGDLTVFGNIDCAFLEVGHDLIVNGGIIGTQAVPIKVAHHCIAKHLQNTWLEVEGDVHVISSCLQSRIETSGHFFCTDQRGVMSGGSLVCMRGAEINMLGADSGAPTRVIIGQDFMVRKRIREAEVARVSIQAGLKRIDDFLGPVLKRIQESPGAFDEAQSIRLRHVVAQRKEMSNHIQLLNNRLHRLYQAVTTPDGVQLCIRGTIYADTRVTICDKQWIPDTDYRNVIVTTDPKTGTLEIKNIKTLRRSA